jgi:RecB family endonuclease NucS
LLFGRKLGEKLSLNFKFSPTGHEAQTIASSTRAWRTLTDKDVGTLRRAIKSERGRIHPRLAKSTEEVGEVIEKDVEDHLARSPRLISKGLKLADRQLSIRSGRIDLLFEDQTGNLTVVEVKLNKIGRDALQQVQRYIHELKVTSAGKKVSGVIVCTGVMPAYENDLRKQNDVRILIYGWEMQVRQW